MKAFTAGAACAAALLFSTPGATQTTNQQPLVIGATAPANVLRAGTEIPLRTLTEVNSRESKVGDRFNLEVAENVTLGGKIIIPVGTQAVGEVTKVVGKGMFGKSGKIETRLLYVKMGDQQLRIRGTVGDRGKGGTAATVGALAVVPIAAFFVTGTSAVLAPGSSAMGYLESDLSLVFADTAPSNVVVVPAQPKQP